MKKKGFTLIELLAVIIILAVIALIATPVVLNIIEQVKIKSAEASAKGYAKAVEYEILNDTMFKGKNLDGEYDVEENVLEVVYQGNGPSEGYFILTRNEITYGEFCINGYGIKYENSIGKYSPNEVICSGSVPKHEFIEPEGVACTDIENYDDETNFKIKTVEDLVCISNLSKNGKTFSGKTVMLLSDIDINDSNSYNDINDTIYGDINGNGTIEGIQVELTTGSGFLPIGSSSVPFSGTFEGYGFTLSNLYINRSKKENTGLFGYASGLIRGLNVKDVNITGYYYVGGVVGYLNQGTVNEINLTGNISGTSSNIGGIVGYGNGATINNVLVNADVTTQGREAGGVVGTANSTPVNGIVETGTISGSYAYKVGYIPNAIGNPYSSSLVTAQWGSTCAGTNYTLNEQMLSSYDNTLDTWIGGDNDSSGYYFDYDSNNKIIVKSVEREPITFTLKGEGTQENPYLINNYQQWKEATTKVKQDVYIKLNADIDFSGKNYYAMGSSSNYLVATIDGGYHTISNINIGGLNNSGLFGYINGGTVKGFNINNSSIKSSNDNIGLISGYVTNSGKIEGINVTAVSVSGGAYSGGVVGYLNQSTVNEIALSGNVFGTASNVGGIVGYGNGAAINNVLVNADVTTQGREAGGVVGTANSTPVNGIVETGTISGSYAYKVGYIPNAIGNPYSSSLVTAQWGSTCAGTNYTLNEQMLSSYDNTLDTWIGGDDDSSGYYFDYDNNNKIVIKSVERDPITFTLSGSGTESDPYLINNYQQWKEATTKVDQKVYIKLNTDIDFSGKNYYAMGSNNNKLIATIDGGYHTISNINIGGLNNSGLFGYINGGTVKGFNINNSSIKSSNDYIGLISGYVTNSGKIEGINVTAVSVSGGAYSGGVVGYLNQSTVNEIALSGNVFGTASNVGGIVGYGNGATINSVLVNADVTTQGREAGGIVGTAKSTPVNGIVETGKISGSYSYKAGYLASGAIYSSNLVTAQWGSTSAGTGYTLELPTTVTYTENNNRVEVDTLSYYNNGGAIDTVIGGDNDSSGYYFDYNSSGNKIIVVPSGAGVINPGGNVGTTGSVEIDSNYTMTQINGTTDTTAPTCELYYVRAVSNGIQASFSCTDDSGVPTLRSLFDSTTSKSAQTFDNIGTLKNGSVSGNTKTVVSTWNVNNTISQPTPGTCYYFRYGAKDAQNNFSTYVTNVCYTGFSE